jgi:hypothetical protein
VTTKTKPVAGWYRDPSQRHEHRWWNGDEWTPHVLTLGMRSLDYGVDDPFTSAAAAAATATVQETTTSETATAEPATAESATDVTVATRPQTWPRAVWAMVLLGGAAIALGAALPWAEASSASASFSSAGVDGNGALTLAAALALGAICVLGGRRRSSAALMVVVAVVVGAIGVRDAADIAHDADRLVARLPGVSAGVGVGVWVTIAGAVIALAGALMAFAATTRRA